MPSANRLSTPVGVELPGIEIRYAQLEGYTVSFERFTEDVDPSPYFVGLPGDRCQCPHWGIVTEGQVTFRWTDREETYMAGDAYYAPPGHLPLITAGTTFIEFSPAEDLAATSAVIERNLAEAGAAS